MKELVKIAIDEEFRPVEGFEDYYISTYGRLWSDKSNKFLKCLIENHGYYRYKLYREGNPYVYKVHRLVALTFIPNSAPEVKVEVNHIDGDKANNKASNLEWVTHQGNMKHAADTGLTCPSSDDRKLTVYVYKENRLVGSYYGIRQCGRELGIDRHVIINSDRNGTTSKAGYRFVVERTSDQKEVKVA